MSSTSSAPRLLSILVLDGNFFRGRVFAGRCIDEWQRQNFGFAEHAINATAQRDRKARLNLQSVLSGTAGATEYDAPKKSY